MAGTATSSGDQFVWRQGRAEVTLERAGGAWSVVYTSAGRLLGPRQILYRGSHKVMQHAAWDVMARVIRACRDEDEGLRVGRSAAQWLRAHNIPDDDPDNDWNDPGLGSAGATGAHA